MEWSIFAWILIINTFIALGVAWRIKVHGLRQAGAAMLFWLLIAIALWGFSYAMLIFSFSLEAKRFWLKVENIGIVSTPLLWFLFASAYTKKDKWLNKKTTLLLAIIPILTVFFLFSERWFDLYYTSIAPYTTDIGPLTIEKGIWYKVQVIQSYLTIGGGILLLFWHLIVFREIYKERVITLFIALAAPIALNAFYHKGAGLIPDIYIPVDLTPIAFTISALLINFAIYRQELFATTPIARQIVLENIIEMVLVVDEKNYIVDVNRAALNWLQKKEKNIVGKNILEIFAAYPQLASHYQTEGVANNIFPFKDDNQRVLNVTISPIYNRLGNLEGRVLIAHDVTKEELLKAEVKEKAEKIKALEAKLKKQGLFVK